MSSKSLYEILQVHPDASPEVVKAAYKSLSTKYHPDRDKSADAARRFAEFQQAFEVLSDPDRRRRYDANPAQDTAAFSGSSVVFRLDGSSTFLTLEEHQRRGWKEAASCDLSNHDFSGVSFKNAKLTKARLDGSRMNGCDFRGADLTDCSAKECHFDRADFTGVRLIHTDFSGSSMRAANLAALGTLAACDFTGTNLTDADMKGADIRKSVFLRSSLQRAQMQGCNIGSIDLASCNLVDTNLTECIIDDATLFPEGYGVPNRAKNSQKEQRELAQKNKVEHRIAGGIFLSALVLILGLILLRHLTSSPFTKSSFMGVDGVGSTVVYLIDTSSSMGGSRLRIAQSELKASLRLLQPNEKFAVILFNEYRERLKLKRNDDQPVYFATDVNKELASHQIDRITADRGTVVMPAILEAISLKPDVIYFLTDGDASELSPAELSMIKTLTGNITIHVVKFGDGTISSRGPSCLERLAHQSNGEYRELNPDNR